MEVLASGMCNCDRRSALDCNGMPNHGKPCPCDCHGISRKPPQGGSGTAPPRSKLCPACNSDCYVLVGGNIQQGCNPGQYTAKEYVEGKSANDVQVGGTHYKETTLQPWEVIDAWFTYEERVGFYRGNMLKYFYRYKLKGGIEDQRKMQHYHAKLIEVMQEHEGKR